MSLMEGIEEKLYLIEIIKHFQHRDNNVDLWWCRLSKEPSDSLYVERFISTNLAKKLMDIVKTPISYSKQRAVLVRYDRHFAGYILDVNIYKD